MSTASAKSPDFIRTERLKTPRHEWNLTLAALWPKKGENLGTLLRTCDAVGAGLAVPSTSNATKAITKGNTIGVHNSPIEYVEIPPLIWLMYRQNSHRIIGVELAHGAIPLSELAPASDYPTIVLLGHEATGLDQTALTLCDEVVEIPMEGVGNSLNVAVAGSIVAYKLRGWT